MLPLDGVAATGSSDANKRVTTVPETPVFEDTRLCLGAPVKFNSIFIGLIRRR